MKYIGYQSYITNSVDQDEISHRLFSYISCGYSMKLSILSNG